MTQFVALGETPLHLFAPGYKRLEQAETLDLSADGTESNAVVAAHTLGTHALWVSRLADSPLGRRVHAEIDAQGVETDVTWVERGHQGLVFHEQAVSPRETRQVNRHEDVAIASATPGNLPMDSIQDAEILCTGLRTAVLSQEIAETATTLLRAGRGAGATTIIAFDHDPALVKPEVYRGVFERLAEHTDVVIGPETAIQRVLETDTSGRELASTLTVEYELDIAAVVELGGDGVVIQETPGTNFAHERDGLAGKSIDTRGEFGAIVGGFAHALLRGSDPAGALDTALAAGALARSIEGPFLETTPEELDAVLSQIQTSPGGSRY